MYIIWYISLSVAILTYGDIKFISLMVDHVDIFVVSLLFVFVVSLRVQSIFRRYA